MTQRSVILIGLLAFSIVVAGCGGPPPAAPAKEAPQRAALLVTAAGDAVALDPAAVSVNGPEVSLTLYFTKKEIKNGVKTEVWQAVFRPSERLVAIKAKRLLDESAKAVSADTGDFGTEYVIPGSNTERIMNAVTDYCKKQALPLDDTPAPYVLPGYKYIAKSTANQAYYLYNPASVKASGGQRSVEVLMVNEAVHNGIKYAIATVTLEPAKKQYQTTALTLYDAKGGKLPAPAADAKWYAVIPNSVYDMLMDAIK